MLLVLSFILTFQFFDDSQAFAKKGKLLQMVSDEFRHRLDEECAADKVCVGLKVASQIGSVIDFGEAISDATLMIKLVDMQLHGEQGGGRFIRHDIPAGETLNGVKFYELDGECHQLELRVFQLGEEGEVHGSLVFSSGAERLVLNSCR